MADLSDVKVGDKIAYQNPYSCWSGPKVAIRLLTVDKITPTQVVCGSDRFHKLTGKKIGSSNWGSAEPATQELLDEINVQEKKGSNLEKIKSCSREASGTC